MHDEPPIVETVHARMDAAAADLDAIMKAAIANYFMLPAEEQRRRELAFLAAVTPHSSGEPRLAHDPESSRPCLNCGHALPHGRFDYEEDRDLCEESRCYCTENDRVIADMAAEIVRLRREVARS